ncbi:phosphatase PAP2 family protein [Flavobacterium sp. RHBU_24]|uniref:phosphatase PAP2 family protein n=1 Tax=Flavobacterium sp. RHBU_24 TaxID=3391185 RepID=UPI003984CE49
MAKFIPNCFLLPCLFFSILMSYGQSDSLLINHDSVVSVTRTDSTFSRRLTYDLKNMFGGVVYTYASPFRWKKENLPAIAAFAGGTGLLLLADQDASTYFVRQGEGMPTALKELGFYMGKPQYNYTFSAALYFTGLVTKSEKLRHTGVLIIASATAGGFIQTISKSAAGRARPSTGYGHLHFKPFGKGAGYHSFPSGHSILSATAIYAISKQFSNPWAKAGILSAGLITPVSRLWDNAHWLSDVGLGIGVSIVTVEAVERYLMRGEKYDTAKIKDPRAKKISWNLRAGYNQMGVVGVF